MWLDCLSERKIAEQVGITQPTVGEWVKEKVSSVEFFQPSARTPTSARMYRKYNISAKWLVRYAAFAVASGVPASNVESAITAINEHLPLLSPEQDEAMLRDAGFTDAALFYAGFTFRGWVGYKV